MRLWWRRRRAESWSPPDRIPDHDQVRLPGQVPWRELLAQQEGAEDYGWLNGPTRLLPVYRPPRRDPGLQWRDGGDYGGA
jgi:hypothetical protein